LSAIEPGGFGYDLAELRRDRWMSLSSLSDLTHIAPSRLEALEAGAGIPNRREIRQLAVAFRMSFEAMLVKAGQRRLVFDWGTSHARK
jgi:transcriptional regulator with XRE-family HTH domain